MYDEFCAGVANIVKNMKTGSSLGNPHVDCGAITMVRTHCRTTSYVDAGANVDMDPRFKLICVLVWWILYVS